ncbi:MAG: hypothetical protein QE283_09230 [Rhodoferax sp.]|nr:hypothetical protein [Rhodoferax sp.]
MKIVIHMGMPKTGSTAIQRALANSREELISAGVLYPKNIEPFGTQVKHLLCKTLLCQGDTDQWRGFPDAEAKIEKNYGKDVNFFEIWLADLKSQIRSANPHTLLISEESFFAAFSKRNTAIHVNLQKLLSELGVTADDLELVGYLRSPPDYYLSSCQQGLKGKSTLKDISRANYFPALKRIRKKYNSQHTIFPFDRKLFPGGDIVKHFSKHVAGIEIESQGMPNETISGPAMSILQDYRAIFHPENGSRGNPRQVKGLIESLREAGLRLGLDRPSLKAEVKAFVWESLGENLAWLKKNYAIEFDQSNSIGDINTELNIQAFKPTKVSDILDIDEDKKYRLLLEVLFMQASVGKKKSKAEA